MDNQSRAKEINLPEEAEEYGSLESSKIITAQVAVGSHQALFESNSIR
jgi:hypothetical protein